jgi:CRP-like cAMP-binding protein
MESLIKFITDFSPQIKDHELDLVLSKFSIRKLKKDKFLLKKGKVCNEFVIVHKGCFRIFSPSEGIELNSWFSFENMTATEFESFYNRKPSFYSVQAIEDAEIYVISHKDLQALYNEIENFKYFGLRLNELLVTNVINILISCQFKTPEERYLDVMNNPNYMNRIPLKDLASFIGLTPNSLSRLRSRLVRKQKM